jgi:U3 small nucleolar RNA-associated protein MPP10
MFEVNLVLMEVCFRFNEVKTSDVENDAVGARSSLEMRQERLQVRLVQLEEQALAEKPWQMKGEVSASSRPQNSLLEEVVEFDLTTRPGELSIEEVRSICYSNSLQNILPFGWLVG